MRLAVVIGVALYALPAHAQPKLEVTTAASGDAWRNGRSSPFVVKLTGVAKPKATIRVDCHGSSNSFVRAHNVRIGVATPALSDFAVRAIPKVEEVGCTAYEGDHYLADWRGTLGWPNTTLPDHRITNLVANRCGTDWCVDVTLDRSHPGTVDAEVEVLCQLRHASTDKLFVHAAPWSREQVMTTATQARVKLADAAGATALTCSVDRGLYGNARFADADATNNEATTTVANTSKQPAQLALIGTLGASIQRGCGNCSTYIPGSVSLAMQVESRGTAVSGVGVRCDVDASGTTFQLVGAGPAMSARSQALVTVTIQNSAATASKLVGKLTTRCEAVVWDRPTKKPVRWTGTVTFPKP